MVPRRGYRGYLCPFLAALAGTAYLSPSAVAAPPIAEYRFNGTGTSAANTGSDTTALNFFDATSSPANLYGPAGSGVSGLAGDLAFDNRGSSAMGNPGPGGFAAQTADVPATDGLRSFTVQGWFKTEGAQAIGRDAALVNNQGNGGGWSIRSQGRPNSGNVGNLTLMFNDGTTIQEVYSAPAVDQSGPYSQTQAWVFFAVSYDGTLTSNNVKFYQGGTASAVTLAATRTLDGGAAGDDDNPLKIGNVAAAVTRPFDGLMDDVRLFGSAADASGVLDQSTLEGLRQADVLNLNTPEPSTVSGFISLAAPALALRRTRRRRPAARGANPQT